jgi:hypothetical protein
MATAQREVIDAQHLGVPAAGSGRARIRRSKVDLLAGHASRPLSRAPARPPSANATACSVSLSPLLRRP